MKKSITRILVLILVLLPSSLLSNTKGVKGRKPHVVFKFDDLSHKNWKVWKTITDIIIQKNITADLGIFTSSLASGDQEYYNYVQSLLNDPEHFEIWLHGHSGGAKEFFDTDYPAQLESFRLSRTEMLKKYDFILRYFGGHYYGGNENTVKIINEDPFLKGWIFSQTYTKKGGKIVPSKQVMADRKVNMEPVTAVVSYDKYISGWTKFNADTLPYVVLQGHPWGYSTDSLKNEFIRIVDDLKARNVVFTHFGVYDRMTKGYSTDKTPPSAPTGLIVERIDTSHVKLTWKASDDPQSGVNCYKIYHDGVCIDLSASTSYIDEINGSHQYQLRAVNNNDQTSKKSKIVHSN